MTAYRRDLRDYAPTDAPLAVIVCRTPDGTHAGILYFADDDGTRVVLHLAFHGMLRLDLLEHEPLWGPAMWAAPPVDTEVAEAVAALCRRVYRTHGEGGLPYALRYLEARFDIGTGTLLLGPASAGLTCATFVLALLRSGNVHLLCQSEWRPRAGDEVWQESILRTLARWGGVAAGHLDAVRAELGCARFRPTDDLAGAASERIPLGFDAASRAGRELQSILDALPLAK